MCGTILTMGTKGVVGDTVGTGGVRLQKWRYRVKKGPFFRHNIPREEGLLVQFSEIITE
jgi:hypothetical protein